MEMRRFELRMKAASPLWPTEAREGMSKGELVPKTQAIDQPRRIADQLRRAFSGPAWHGPAVLELVANVDAKVAAAKPVPNAHSIWEIVNHLSAWEEALQQRLEGRTVELEGEADWPPVVESTAAAWKQALTNLRKRHAALVNAVESATPHRLLDTVPNRDHDFYHMLHGCVQHELYHAGQIAILKKAQS
jgi:uncharacterized damage-inducible protein DinB